MFSPSSPSRITHSVRAAVLFAGLGLALAPTAQADAVAPAFSGQNLNPKATDYQGEVSLESLQGKVVLLNFWATWCGPCKLEMPHIQSIYDDNKDKGFVVVSVSIDDARDKSQIKPTIMSKKLTFPVIHDQDTSIVSQYNPTKTLPYTVIIDAEGRISQVHQGYTPGDETALRTEVEELLAAE